MMRQRDIFFHSLFGVLFLITFTGSALADLSTQQIVDDFNTMNNQQGYLYRTRIIQTGLFGFYGQRSGEIRLANDAPSTGQTPDVSAYAPVLTANSSPDIDVYFQTFCVAPEIPMVGNDPLSGRLNYESDRTATSNGNVLPTGVAWLYKEFAAGTLNGYYYDNVDSMYNRVNSAVMLQDAIWFLMGDTANLFDPGTNWTNNRFLELLNNKSGYTQAFWLAAYDPADDYGGLMDGVEVFVMNVRVATNAANVRQDVLYVVQNGSSVVLEPASLLLWVFGGIGAVRMAYQNRRKTNK